VKTVSHIWFYKIINEVMNVMIKKGVLRRWLYHGWESKTTLIKI